MVDILLPRMGLTMETGTVARWHVNVGEKFETGQALFDVESDKITNTVEARFDGVLTEVIAKEGEEYETGTVIATVEKI